MKRQTIQLICFFILVSLRLSAYDFKMANKDGAVIYYKVTSKEKHTVAVTNTYMLPKKTNEIQIVKYSHYDIKPDGYSGNVVIPAEVTDSAGVSYTVTSIANAAFWRCTKLKSVTIPSTVTSIGESAFRGCEELEAIEIPGTVKTFGIAIFHDCTELKKVTLPEGMEALPNMMFLNCASLSAIDIPSTVTSIGESAFHGCISLTSIELPAGLKSIGSDAFRNYSLKEVRMPSNEAVASVKPLYEWDSITKIVASVKKPAAPAKKATTPQKQQQKQLPSKPEVKQNQPELAQAKPEPQPKKEPEVKVVAPKEKPKTEPKPEPKPVQKPEVKPANKQSFDLKTFPIINISDVEFADDGNNIIERNEKCALKFKVSNTGKGDATGCIAVVEISNAPGVKAKNLNLPVIPAGETVDITLDITADATVKGGTANIKLSVDEPNGFGCDPTLLAVTTQGFLEPKVLIADYSITSGQGTQLAKRMPFDLQVLVQNAARGNADDVSVDIEVPKNVFVLEGEPRTELGKIEGGGTQSMVYSLIVNNNYTEKTIPITFTLHEKYGKYSENRVINLNLDQSFAQNKIEVKQNVDNNNQQMELAKIDGARHQVDIDHNIPETGARSSKTFAVVIANENYRREEPVKFASNDGRTMAQYLQKTLGLPEENIHMAIDATLNEMRDQISWMKMVSEAYKGNVSFILYYAGHGMPDESSGKAYLIPSDGNSQNVSSCIALNSLYDELSGMKAQRVSVLLDACFSGAQRGNGMLMAARGVAIKARNELPKGNLVVFSAAQGAETAYPYNEMGHGLFTYYILKKLQETKGEATLGEIDEYVSTEVKQRSVVVNNKSQTPTMSVSPNVTNDWRNWRLN